MVVTDPGGGDAAGRTQGHRTQGDRTQGESESEGGTSFADVLNGLFLAPPRRRATAELPAAPAGPPRAEPRHAEPADDWTEWQEPAEQAAQPSNVRPYARTGGRTHAVRDLAVETLVHTTAMGREAEGASVEHAPVARLCEEIRSVAEVSALLAVPLGVARILIADMVDWGLVDVHRNPTAEDGYPDLSLLERVLEGLRNL